MVLRRLGSKVVVCEVDDASVTSTVSVGSSSAINKTAPLHRQGNTSKSRKSSVRFDLDANVEHDHPLCKDECAGSWYNRIEYKYFKVSTMRACRALCRAETKNRAAFSYERVLEQTFQTCCQYEDMIREDENGEKEPASYLSLSTPRERLYLYQWAEVAPNRVGLEKWALRKLVQERKQRRFELTEFIRNFRQVQAKNCTQEDRAEFIRMKCQHISRTSRMFAQALAQAYAEAAA